MLLALVLATRRFDIDSRGKYRRTALWHAARNGHRAIVKLLIEESVKPETNYQHDGRTLSSSMADQGPKVGVRTLLETDKVDVDSKDKDGNTPLIMASKGMSFRSSFCLIQRYHKSFHRNISYDAVQPAGGNADSECYNRRT